MIVPPPGLTCPLHRCCSDRPIAVCHPPPTCPPPPKTPPATATATKMGHLKRGLLVATGTSTPLSWGIAGRAGRRARPRLAVACGAAARQFHRSTGGGPDLGASTPAKGRRVPEPSVAPRAGAALSGRPASSAFLHNWPRPSQLKLHICSHVSDIGKDTKKQPSTPKHL